MTMTTVKDKGFSLTMMKDWDSLVTMMKDSRDHDEGQGLSGADDAGEDQGLSEDDGKG